MEANRRFLPILALAACLGSCTFYSTATHWNTRVGPNGKPVFYRSATRVGLNLLIFLPFLGRTDIDRMIDTATANVAEDGGDVVRVVQAESENYWYGFSPLTWLITPVISTVDVEYEPSAAELDKARAEEAAEKTRTPTQAEPLDTRPITPPQQQHPAQDGSRR
ncbi:MAG: hypothetical protein U1F36_07675 [Planctomycetota bacterium]